MGDTVSGLCRLFRFWREGVQLHLCRPYQLSDKIGVSKGGIPFGTRLCLQSVVCYTLCRRCCENEVATGRASTFEAAEQQGCDCVAWSRNHKAGFISRQGVYEGIFAYPTPMIYNRIFFISPNKQNFLCKFNFSSFM